MEIVDSSQVKGPKRSRRIIYLIVSCLIGLTLWAAFAEVSEVVRGTGTIVPRVQTQLVQNLEGGIVQDILVSSGDFVEEGQLIVQMNTSELTSAYQELLEQSLALQIRLLRLDAERAEESTFNVTESLRLAAPDTAASEQALFQARMSEFIDTRNGLQGMRDLQAEEVALLEPMVARDSVPMVDFLRVRLALTEAEQKLGSYVSDFHSQRAELYSETLVQFQQLAQQLIIRKDQLDRAQILSPVKGVINRIHLNTIGGVVGPGEPILEILPYDERLQVDGRVDPKDIGFVYVGMPATVKFTAFDFAIFGTITGEISHVSADTVIDEAQREPLPYYEVTVTLSTQELSGPDGVVQIRPGMQAEIELESGDRTILEYLLKPLFRATEAFSER